MPIFPTRDWSVHELRCSDRELSVRAAAASARRIERRNLARERRLFGWLLRREFRRDVPAAANIVIRPARSDDRAQLERLAALDEQPLPAGGALLAEIDDEIVAAVPLETGAAIANPFRAHRDVVLLLEVRAAQLAA